MKLLLKKITVIIYCYMPQIVLETLFFKPTLG